MSMNFLIIFAARYLIYLSLLSIPYLWVRRERHDLIRIVVSVVVAFAISEGLNFLFPVPRPFVAQNFTPLVGVSLSEYYASFPSGHATFLTALGMAIFFTEKLPGVLILILGILVGIGRVVAGVHYPIDILGGFLIGVAVAALVKFLHDRYPFW